MTDPDIHAKDASHWDKDRLGTRQDEALFLMRALQHRYRASSEQPKLAASVIALNGAWGSGKTFFLAGLKQELEAEQHPVVSFDAWATDFSDDPLIAFIAAIQKQLAPITSADKALQGLLDETVTQGKKLFKSVMRVGTEIAVRQVLRVGTDELLSAYQGAATGSALDGLSDDSTLLSDAATAVFKEHETRIETIGKFHRSLGRLVAQLATTGDKHRLPLFILVDELDRCRPPYAIATLEAIKHLFGVAGVYFVVATNAEQLSHSVRAVYGSEFAAGLYLKRFFDREYALPEAPVDIFCTHILSGLIDPNIDFSPIARLGETQEKPLVSIFVEMAKMFRLSLRDIEQIVGTLSDSIANWTLGEHTRHFPYFVYLAMLQHQRPAFFKARLERRPDSDHLHAELASISWSGDKRLEWYDHDARAVKQASLASLVLAYESFQTHSTQHYFEDPPRGGLEERVFNLLNRGSRTVSRTQMYELTSYASIIAHAGKMSGH